MPRLSVLLVALALPLGLGVSLPAAAADIQVTVLGDGTDADLGDGICDADPATPNVPDPNHPGQFLGQCTLRAALQIANSTPEPDRILLRGDAHILSLVGAGEDAAATGDLDVTSEVEIVGRGYQLSFIDGKRLRDRIFDVRPGGKLTLTGVSLLTGMAPKADFDPGTSVVSGGCIRSAGTTVIGSSFFFHCGSSGNGGAVSVIGGSTTITDTIFHTSKAKNEGGAIAVSELGSLTLDRVTIGASSAGAGGGVAARGALDVTNATITINKSKLGGAVAVLGNGTAAITSSTLSSNGATNLVSQTTGGVTVTNSILFGAKTDCVGSVSSGGGNIEGATSCGFTGTNDQQNTDPLLSRLAFNGSVIPTQAIAANSPAVDHGVETGDVCTSQDARTLPRFDVSGVGVSIIDSGAFELDGTKASLTIDSTAVTDATQGVPYSYDVSATATGRGTCPFSYSLVVSPPGMTIDPSSGLISWTPASTGPAPVTVRAADPTFSNISDTQDFTIQVAAPPAP